MMAKTAKSVDARERQPAETVARDASAFLRESFPNDGYPVTVRRITDRFYRVNRYRPDYRGDSLVRVYEIVQSSLVEVDSTPDGFVMVDHTAKG
jgi:hypothetical protein